MSMLDNMRMVCALTSAAALSVGGHVALLSELNQFVPHRIEDQTTIRMQNQAIHVVQPSRITHSTVTQADGSPPELTDTPSEQLECPPTPQTNLAPSVESDFVHFLPSSQLDIPAEPKSAPELDSLNETVLTGQPIQLRLFINKSGAVVQVDVLKASEDDAPLVDRLKTIFFETAFVAGQINGIEVDSYKDVLITLNPSL